MNMDIENDNIANNVFVEHISPADFDKTVDRLLKEIENKSWKLLHMYDLQETMVKNGKTILPAKVFSLCNVGLAYKILELDSERMVSSIIPCRVSVYEKQDGKTYISMMTSSIISSNFGGVSGQVITDATNEVEEIIKISIKENQ